MRNRLVILLFVLSVFCVAVAGCGDTHHETKETYESGGEPGIETNPLSDAISADSTFSIHFIDVGQADAALVECDGHYMLIDGGNRADSDVIYTVLKNAGVSHLEIVVGTHAHEDHIGGIPGAFNYASAGLTLCPVTTYDDSEAFAHFKRYAQEKGGGIIVPSAGDEYALGSAGVSVLGVNSGSEPNDTSIILKIRYGGTSFLFTGDAEREAEQAVLASGADLSATVLKVGHHGSDTSTTYPFLREVMPAYAVISVGDGNSYGHPTDNTLSRLRDAGVEVYRTDLHGDIFLTSDGTTVTISTDRSGAKEKILKPDDSMAVDPLPAEQGTDPAPVPDSIGMGYVINKNTDKFHDPTCKSVDQMKESNKQFYNGTREELISRGLSPCKNCNP